MKKQLRSNPQRHGATVRCIETDRIYTSIRAASLDTGASEKSISHCVCGRSKTGGGLHWEYAESLCWTCRRCYGKCPWTAYNTHLGKVQFDPVPGWVAKPHKREYNGGIEISYHVITCPLYIADERQ